MAENPIYELDGGVAKILKIYDDHCVLVAQKNFMSLLTQNIFNGDKEFYYSNLTSVQFKQASKWINGYIQFEYPGSHSAGNDFNSENSFAFQLAKLDNEKAVEAVDFIKSKIRESKNPTQTVVSTPSAAVDLKKFMLLLDAGIITQNEFDAKKKELLGL